MPLDMTVTTATRISYRVMPVAGLGRSFRLWRAIRGVLPEEPEFIAVQAADPVQTVETVRAIQTIWGIPALAAVPADDAERTAPLREAGVSLLGLLPPALLSTQASAEDLPEALVPGLEALILPAREQAMLTRTRAALSRRGLSLPVIAEHAFALPGEARVHRFLPLPV